MVIKIALTLRKLIDVDYFGKLSGNLRLFCSSKWLLYRKDDEYEVQNRFNFERERPSVTRIWEKEESFSVLQQRYKPVVEPEKTSVLLFPGQGSQFIGMGKQLLRYPDVEDVYTEASEILGYNVLDMCLNGPQIILDKTVYCQQAVFVTSLAATKKLVADHPEALDHVAGLAGFSVGEITALVFGGVMSFYDGTYAEYCALVTFLMLAYSASVKSYQLIRLRGLAMQEASEAEPGGMMTVFLGSDSQLGSALYAAREFCRNKMDIPYPVCYVAVDLSVHVKVVSGHEPALEFVLKYGKEWNIRGVKPLPVSGAFHTSLMTQGTNWKRFRRMLNKIPLQKPSVAIWSGHNGLLYGTNSNITKEGITYNVTKKVKWEQIMHKIYNNPGQNQFPNTYEVGPGKQLGWVIHKINKNAFAKYKNVEV